MIYSIIVGLIAGWLAGQVMKGGGYGVLMEGPESQIIQFLLRVVF